ncbi:Uncharacterised protein [Mycobacterium tuberculosis]|nr:Uncharacterised protein [Mycobacterium tuberculosis]
MMPTMPTMTGPGPDGGERPAAGSVVTPPMSPEAVAAWGRMRRGVDTVRSGTGRVATLAGTVAAGTVLADPGALPWTLAATAAVTAAGVGTLRLQMPFAGHQKATATVLYTVPGVALGALMAATACGGALLLQLAGVAVWTAGTWLLRPARVARRMACPPPPPAPVDAGGLDAVDGHPAARWWARYVGAEGGAAAGTALEDVQRTGDAAMTATIRATTPGTPVPDISVRRLSALLDWPEDQISITAVPGRGAGVRRLTIGTADAADADADPATVWAERIAPLAMPGAVLTEVRIGTPAADTSTDPTDAADAGAVFPDAESTCVPAGEDVQDVQDADAEDAENAPKEDA